MDREKQIEEIANILWNIPDNYSLNSYNDCKRIAECIYDDGGYRKQSEVAKEIFDAIKEKLIFNTYGIATISNKTFANSKRNTQEKKKMARYIDAEKLEQRLRDFSDWCRDNRKDGATFVLNGMLADTPTADVQEVKHGEWIEDGYGNAPCVCSCCGAEPQYVSKFNEAFDYDWEENLQHTGYEEIREYIKTPYCSQCGAKMDAKE